jgi:hypothetical protein
MSTDESPPGNGSGALAGADPGDTGASDVSRPLNDPATFRNHRIVRVRYALHVWQWEQIRWWAESDSGVERFSRSVSDWRCL